MIDQYGYYMPVLQDLVVGGLLVCGLLYGGVQDLCEGRGWSDWLLYVGCSKTWGGVWLVLLTEPLS